VTGHAVDEAQSIHRESLSLKRSKWSSMLDESYDKEKTSGMKATAKKKIKDIRLNKETIKTFRISPERLRVECLRQLSAACAAANRTKS
jgi:hypothetical protein